MISTSSATTPVGTVTVVFVREAYVVFDDATKETATSYLLRGS
jgi:hypothetical protein